jgi:hypothetical protein
MINSVIVESFIFKRFESNVAVKIGKEKGRSELLFSQVETCVKSLKKLEAYPNIIEYRHIYKS